MTNVQVKHGWQKVKIGDICSFQYGKSLPQRNRISGGYPVFGSGGIVGYHNEYIVQAPCIIVGRKGSIGTVYFSKKHCFPIDTVFYVEENKSVYDILFLYYLLLNNDLARLGGDAAVPGINRNVAYLQEVSLPPLDIQQKIASILSGFDDLIENNTKRIKILEKTAKLIYKEWFVDFKFPGHEKVKMVDSGGEFGEIPEGWEVKSFSELVDINPRISFPKDKIHRFVTMRHISTGAFMTIEDQLVIKNGRKFGHRDVLLARITPCLENGKGGYVLLKDKDEILFGSTEFIVLREKSLPAEYVYVLSRDETFRKHSQKSMVGASGRQRVQNACFDNYKIPCPSRNILENFSKITKPIFEKIYVLENQNIKLRQIRDLFLPKLVSGEVQVDKLTIK